jgi:hypothetical protein
MAPSEMTIDRARRAFERGRMRWALGVGAYVVPMAVVSVVACGRPWVSAANGLLLWALCALGRWRGGRFAAPIGWGLAAGAAALALPLLFHAHGLPCADGACCRGSIPYCWGGGALAGLVVALRAISIREGRASFLVYGCTVAALAGSLGCVVGGLMGLGGLAAGLLLGSAPVVAWGALRTAAR